MKKFKKKELKELADLTELGYELKGKKTKKI